MIASKQAKKTVIILKRCQDSENWRSSDVSHTGFLDPPITVRMDDKLHVLPLSVRFDSLSVVIAVKPEQ